MHNIKFPLKRLTRFFCPTCHFKFPLYPSLIKLNSSKQFSTSPKVQRSKNASEPTKPTLKDLRALSNSLTINRPCSPATTSAIPKDAILKQLPKYLRSAIPNQNLFERQESLSIIFEILNKWNYTTGGTAWILSLCETISTIHHLTQQDLLRPKDLSDFLRLLHHSTTPFNPHQFSHLTPATLLLLISRLLKISTISPLSQTDFNQLLTSFCTSAYSCAPVGEPTGAQAGSLTFVYGVQEIAKVVGQGSGVVSEEQLREIVSVFGINGFYKPHKRRDGSLSYFKRDRFVESVERILEKGEYDAEEEIREYLKELKEIE
ncbi:unnamed protein product [Moneuplotes crassus]|uniref:Uncharacterized protein n=1 Tax=Euplotes crassus TaxID=5936 RepID=A0AAD1XMI0_EUPCR|nr:unnamed protein product [Moneuplotes crassus]